MLAEMPPMFPIVPNLADVARETAARGGCRFGPRINPITGKAQFHNGADLGLALSTPIFAPWDWVCELSCDMGAGGLQLNLVHYTEGLATKFLHLSGFKARHGQSGKQGEIVAYSGNTGASTGPHLHFSIMRAELRNNPKRHVEPQNYYLDPLPFLECTIDVMSHAFEPVESHP